MDYDSRSFTITFIAGVTDISLKVPIIDDDIYEGIETFNVSIDLSNLPKNIDVVNSTVVVRISDDHDSKYLCT